jgi:hypothetical protein
VGFLLMLCFLVNYRKVDTLGLNFFFNFLCLFRSMLIKVRSEEVTS